MRLSQKQNKKLSKTFDVPAPVFLGESRASRMLEKQPTYELYYQSLCARCDSTHAQSRDGTARLRPVAHSLLRTSSVQPATNPDASFPSSMLAWQRLWACMTLVLVLPWELIRASVSKASCSMAQRPRKKNTSPEWHLVRQP